MAKSVSLSPSGAIIACIFAQFTPRYLCHMALSLGLNAWFYLVATDISPRWDYTWYFGNLTPIEIEES